MANEKHRFLTGSRRWTIDKTVVDGITAAIMNALAVSYASITNGVLAASKVMTLDATGSAVMPSGGMFALSRASIAAAGTNQATAAALTAQVNAITASDGTKGVALPAAATTTGPIFVVNTVNTTAALLKIYPVNSGDDNINGLAANLAFFALPGQTLMFIPVSATQWYVEDLSALPAAPLKSQGAANALNSSGTLTAAMMVGGIVTSTTGAAVTATLDTGTLLETALVALYPALKVDHMVEFSVINTGGANAITLATAAGWTDGGGLFTAVAASTSARFGARRTAANTYTGFKLS
jgi:hypothetical protein